MLLSDLFPQSQPFEPLVVPTPQGPASEKLKAFIGKLMKVEVKDSRYFVGMALNFLLK